MGEDIELIGGPFDGLLIRYDSGSGSPDFLEVARPGITWVYARSGDRTRGGAAAFRAARRDVAATGLGDDSRPDRR